MAPARLLDLTRLTSRWGRGPLTGVDRVEFAYLDRLLTDAGKAMGLVRTPVGFLLLDRIGMAALRDGRFDATNDLIGRLARRDNPKRACAEAGLRRLAVDRCTRFGLGRMIRRHLPQGSSFFAVGHADLDRRTLTQIKAAGLKVAALVHDTIPLDHPEFSRPDKLAPFRRKMEAVSECVDLVIHTTEDSRDRSERQFVSMGRVPPGIVAHIGVTLAAPEPLPFVPAHPYFVCLGTIEPRKNHALLLEVWGKLPRPHPTLYIVGGRGWSNEAVFKQLDHLSVDAGIQELPGLPDGQVMTLLAGAQALLFPSFAEGFGLPAIEAAALGTQIIVSDLKVFRELLGGSAVYLDPKDSYSWMETILQQSVLPRAPQTPKIPPDWNKHFNDVFREM